MTSDFTKNLPPSGNPYTPLGTPLHVVQLCLVVLKNVYNQAYNDGYPIGYTDDFENTSLLIDEAFNKESNIWGKKPLIVVQRGGLSYQPVATGNRGIGHSNQKSSFNTSLVNSSINVTVLSKNDNEVDLIGHQVFNVFLTGMEVLRQLTTIHTIQSINLSEKSKSMQDDNMWQCMIQIPYIMQYKWSQGVTQTIIDELAIYINNVLYYEEVLT